MKSNNVDEKKHLLLLAFNSACNGGNGRDGANKTTLDGIILNSPRLE
jgi:hypothetical protein